MESDILTIREIAKYLKIKTKTAYNLASGGKLPGFKVGGVWRFRKAEIARWISQQETQSHTMNGQPA